MSAAYNSLDSGSHPPLLNKDVSSVARKPAAASPESAQLLEEIVLHLRTSIHQPLSAAEPRRVGFYGSARANHSHYFTIMGLLLVVSTYLIVAQNRNNTTDWWYIMLAISIGLNLLGILGVVIASCCNFDGYGRTIEDGASTEQISDRECHCCFHFILLASVICTAIGTFGSLFVPLRMM